MKWLDKKDAYNQTPQGTILDRVPRDKMPNHCHGVDIWLGYELSWLSGCGTNIEKPTYKLGELRIPANSRYIVESKSLKLYFNQFNFVVFKSDQAFINRIKKDIETLLEVKIMVQLYDATALSITPIEGECIDNKYPDDQGLQIDSDVEVKTKTVYSHLFRSNCPVTNQPDWASIIITYSGARIRSRHLLAYLLGYRSHQGFHESCITTIYSDIMTHCNPSKLMVYGAFTRRGGIAIHPIRMSDNFSIKIKPIHLLKT